jgi:hypothetical protein
MNSSSNSKINEHIKHTLIILAVIALLAQSGCKQAAQKQTEMHVVQDTVTIEHVENKYLNEKWYLAVNDSVDGLITVLHDFDMNGKYKSFMTIIMRDDHLEEAQGRYYYQPETKEVFVFIEVNFISEKTAKIAPRRYYKEYHKILELNDTTVVVATLTNEVWRMSKDGKYKLIEPAIQTYQRTIKEQTSP